MERLKLACPKYTLRISFWSWLSFHSNLGESEPRLPLRYKILLCYWRLVKMFFQLLKLTVPQDQCILNGESNLTLHHEVIVTSLPPVKTDGSVKSLSLLSESEWPVDKVFSKSSGFSPWLLHPSHCPSIHSTASLSRD